jgi:capsular exopolysaccharide synthesis family protein
MSYIYEALQRAESERSGESVPNTSDSVAELLQGVEGEIARKQAPASLPLETHLPGAPESPQSSVFSSAKVLLPALAADARIVCLTDQGNMAAEKFRVLGLKLRNLRERRKLKRIVITSSIPEEGKSLVSANLAFNQSRNRLLKTVLIDGDLRRPELASRFGFHRNLAGLSEVLRGERQLSEVVYKLGGSRLWFLPAGVTPDNPIEIMQSGRLPHLLEQLETFFDWILIDTPPVRPLADTPLWMKLADGVLLVTREGVCEKKQLEKAIEVIDGSTMLGVVVNSCSSNEQKYYYARYSSTTDVADSSTVPSKL